MKIPLFPLNTVLFPGGVLPLRIFEARYMDMVRDCLKTDAPFGVCLIRRGQETGAAAVPEQVGCLARIANWDMRQLGVLHIRAIGTQRFRFAAAETQSDGLLVAQAELIEPDADQPIAPTHRACVDLLLRVITDLRTRHQQEAAAEDAEGEAASLGLPFEEPLQFESSVWVGNRLCEVLPVPLKAKQKLMELGSAEARLDVLVQYLRQHAVIK